MNNDYFMLEDFKYSGYFLNHEFNVTFTYVIN